MVIATKYCGSWQMHDHGKHKMQSNFGGGASKNLHVCVEASLKKLRTSYIDLVSSPLIPSCIEKRQACSIGGPGKRLGWSGNLTVGKEVLD